MKRYYITWQPEIAESGHYFLTVVKSDSSDVKDLMELAHFEEGLEIGVYDLCSIICSEDAYLIY